MIAGGQNKNPDKLTQFLTPARFASSVYLARKTEGFCLTFKKM